ncbi:biotin/lipoyl-binding protein [Pseudomonas asiatica]|uniref:biotin/lipoyl-binding protein n=1 Tax=Pseudomonas asiatica TaxID=2219225 RepID=UPI00399B9D79
MNTHEPEQARAAVMPQPARMKIVGVVLCVAAILLLAVGWLTLRSADAAFTDNAYVRGDVTSLAAKVSGYVTAVEVGDNQQVRAGDVLFRIDDRDYRAHLAQAQANLKAAEARLGDVDAQTRLQQAQVRQAEAQRQSAQAERQLASKTHERSRKLIQYSAISQALVDQTDAARSSAEAALKAAAATLDAQRQRIAVLDAQREAAVAAIAQARAARDLALIELEHTVVRAPVAGVIGNRQVLLPSGVVFIAVLLGVAYLIQVRGIAPFATVPFGILAIMAAMWMLSGSTRESGMHDMMAAVILRGAGLGLLFLSLTLIAFGRLGRHSLASGIGLFNTGRQVGGLLGVAGLQTLLDQYGVLNAQTLGAHVSTGATAVNERLDSVTSMLRLEGIDPPAAGRVAMSLLSQAVTGQGAVIAFDTAFIAVALLFAVAAPLLVCIKLLLARMAGKQDAGQSHEGELPVSRREFSL